MKSLNTHVILHFIHAKDAQITEHVIRFWDFTWVVDRTQVLPNGNLVFPPFRAEDYRQEVHAQVYSCLARSSSGSVHSRDVNVRAGKRRFSHFLYFTV